MTLKKLKQELKKKEVVKGSALLVLSGKDYRYFGLYQKVVRFENKGYFYLDLQLSPGREQCLRVSNIQSIKLVTPLEMVMKINHLMGPSVYF